MELPSPATPASTQDVLARLPLEAIVRVVVRAPEAPLADVQPLPRDFDTALSYRTALIEHHRQAQAPGKSKLEELAKALGLHVQSASTLNAVTVEGSAGQVLELLTQLPGTHAVLERPLAGR